MSAPKGPIAKSGGGQPKPRPATAGAARSTAARPPAKPAGPKVTLPRPGKQAQSGPYKVDVTRRIGAGVIDGLLALVPGIAVLLQLGVIGAVVLPILYLLLRDAMPIAPLEYQSIGKKILGLHVEKTSTGESRLDPVTSLKRNAPLVIGLLLAPLVAALSPVLAAVVAVLPGIVETVMAATDPNGLRFGDRIAGTKVLD